MAEPDSTQDDVERQEIYPKEEAAPIGTALNVLGAMASLALIAGIGVWGYQLVMRDVSGVPVVRAIEGPMRVQPVDPGGREADHQGLAVNAVAAVGSAQAPADRLMLAPRPVDLTDEDRPIAKAALATGPGPVDEVKSGSVQSLVDQLVSGMLAGPETEAPVVQAAMRIEQPAALDTARQQPAAGEQTPQNAQDDPAEQAAREQIVPAVLAGPGLAQSLRPRPRPAHARRTAAVATPAAARATAEIDPDSLPVGTRLAQLGAFESAAVARQEWDRLAGRFGDYMEDKSRVIQRASSGGRVFYRLRAMGFADLSEARRFCSVLVAARADCIPVTTR
ncbi:SPOR domain-containing protein [Sedimentitalea sp. HM32M-2]|uniref:SPOR domain-containing protein n=1 Tax=Sedimentitalea sp. HM32M-2 TaxID=3351566 RepID=UPI00363384EB